MILEGVDPKTGKRYRIDAANFASADVDEINSIDLPDKDLKRVIGRLNVSADTKSALFKISKVAIKAGKILLKVGRKIIEIIVRIFTSFPEAGFGLILGALLGAVLGGIPILGIVIGPLVTPIFAALGLVMGLQQDLTNKALAREIAKAQSKFQNLSA